MINKSLVLFMSEVEQDKEVKDRLFSFRETRVIGILYKMAFKSLVVTKQNR